MPLTGALPDCSAFGIAGGWGSVIQRSAASAPAAANKSAAVAATTENRLLIISSLGWGVPRLPACDAAGKMISSRGGDHGLQGDRRRRVDMARRQVDRGQPDA